MTVSERVKNDPGAWLPLLAEYRLTALPDETLLKGVLRDGLSPASPEVREVLDRWTGQAHLHHEDDVTDVVLIYPRGEPIRGRLWVHAGLLLATLVTTLAAGAMMLGQDPFGTGVLSVGNLMLPYPTGLRWAALGAGASFALPFLSVLLVHEMGHFTAARVHRVRASLPYFIPFPPYFSIIGTVGAFIRLRGPTVRRAGLFDIGAAGPLASFVLSLPLLAMGLGLSEVAPADASLTTPFLVQFVGQPVWLGSGLLTSAMALMFGPEGALSGALILHPLAFAGWLGLFVTALNLLPFGQLDGGHVLYALMGAAQSRAARVFLIALIPLGFLWWGWWAWAAVVAILHRGRMSHPPVLQPTPEVGRLRRLLGWALVVVFFLTFVPVPLAL
jgi:membrane-associated protease RseP (regulator of RpoE activity)